MKSLQQILLESEFKEAVGIIIVARNTGNFLLLHRVTEPLVWSVLSGTMDVAGETPLETVKREIKEEIGIDSSFIQNITKAGVSKSKNRHFHVFVGYVDEEFDIPNLQIEENDDYGWFNENNLPTPIHNRWDKTFQLVRNLL